MLNNEVEITSDDIDYNIMKMFDFTKLLSLKDLLSPFMESHWEPTDILIMLND